MSGANISDFGQHAGPITAGPAAPFFQHRQGLFVTAFLRQGSSHIEIEQKILGVFFKGFQTVSLRLRKIPCVVGRATQLGFDRDTVWIESDRPFDRPEGLFRPADGLQAMQVTGIPLHD